MIAIDKLYFRNWKFIDLFAGLGGFRLALESLGAECVYSNEWDIPAQELITFTVITFPACIRRCLSVTSFLTLSAYSLGNP